MRKKLYVITKKTAICLLAALVAACPVFGAEPGDIETEEGIEDVDAIDQEDDTGLIPEETPEDIEMPEDQEEPLEEEALEEEGGDLEARFMTKEEAYAYIDRCLMDYVPYADMSRSPLTYDEISQLPAA